MTAKIRVLFGSNGFPCGILEIASFISRFDFVETQIVPLAASEEDGLGVIFRNTVREFRPDIIGFRIEGGTAEKVCRQIREVRQYCSELKRPFAKIALGGPTATIHPDEVLKETGADYVFAGDAEEAFGRFIKQAGNETAHIFECGYVSEKILRENILNWNLLRGFENTPFDSLYFTGGRGCPGRCTFCIRLHGSSVRVKPAKQIIQEIQEADRLAAEGKLKLTKWELYKDCGNSKLENELQKQKVAWCSVFDEDFFLERKRAVQFLQLFEFYGFQKRYRLNFQTNPCSLLDKEGKFDAQLFYWFKRLKPMIQIGAESFHPQLLKRWKKRHNAEQLETVLDALDKTGIDYNVFHIWTDYHSSTAEIIESAELLVRAAEKHSRMRIASTPYIFPLYGTEIQKDLEKTLRLCGKSGYFEHFTDYEVAHPELLPKEVSELAEKLDDVFQESFYLEKRQNSLKKAAEFLL